MEPQVSQMHLNSFFCGQFHQTLCAKQKLAGAECSAQNSPFCFTNFETAEFCQITLQNFTNSLRHSPNTIRQQKLLILFTKKSLAKILVKLTPDVFELVN